MASTTMDSTEPRPRDPSDQILVVNAEGMSADIFISRCVQGTRSYSKHPFHSYAAITGNRTI